MTYGSVPEIKINYFLTARNKYGRYIQIDYNYEGTKPFHGMREDFNFSQKRLLAAQLFNSDVGLDECIEYSIKLLEEHSVKIPLKTSGSGKVLWNKGEIREHLKGMWQYA